MSDQALVVDVGSSSVKAGFCGEDWPSTLMPSTLEPQPKGITLVESASAEYYSTDISSRARHPIHRGVVKNWEHMESLWGNVMKDVGTGKHMPSIMLVERLNMTHEERKNWAEMLFETFHVPSICLANSASLSLFASGRTTGLVADVGAGLCSAIPIFEGLVLTHGASTLEFGGQDMTYHLQSALLERGTQLDLYDTRILKEKMCYVKNSNTPASAEIMKYELPDGREIDVDGSILWECTEKLVNNSNLVPNGLSMQVSESISLCDESLRHSLASNIVLAGGTSMMKGLGDRVQEDIQKSFSSIDDLSTLDVRVSPSSAFREAGFTTQRRYAAWIGGSIISSLNSYKHLRITRTEWEESSDNILQTKNI
jgi:actin, other eukaryote